MGYDINVQEVNFTIKEKNKEDALNALKEYCKDKTHGDWYYPEEILQAKTLEEALEEMRWEPTVSGGDITNLVFTGERLGEEEFIFQVLGPFVEIECYIKILGECGYNWMYYFDGNRMSEKEGKVTYE